MKVDIDKKHPLTAVRLTPENQAEESLTEEETAEFCRAALRTVRLLALALVFVPFAFLCELMGNLALSSAGKWERILSVAGYIGLGCLIITLVLVFLAGRKLSALSRKYEAENANRKDDSP